MKIRLMEILKDNHEKIEIYEKDFISIEKKLKSADKIIIYGAGVYGDTIYNSLTCEIGVNVACFVDMNEKLWDTEHFDGCKVRPPKALLDDEALVIVAVNDYHRKAPIRKEIDDLLQELHVQNVIDGHDIEMFWPVNVPLFHKQFHVAIAEDEKDYYKNEYGLYDFHIDFFNELSQRVNLNGKRILEIGGSNLPKELVIGKAKSKQWVCIDKPWVCNDVARKNHFSKIKLSKFHSSASIDDQNLNYIIFEEFSDDIPEDFFGKFDICVSNCSLEHISNLPYTIEKIYRCLKDGGSFYASAGPIYSSYNGNHIWISNEINHGNLPVDLYYKHLLLGYTEMYSEIEQKYGTEFARKYTSEYMAAGAGINRLFYEDYVFIMQASDFSKKSVSPQWRFNLDKEVYQKLTTKYPRYSRFDVTGVVICAKK